MEHKFTIVKATYPKKFVFAISFVLLLWLSGLLNDKFHFLNGDNDGYGNLIMVVFTLVFLYVMFMAESFKRIGKIIFSDDHITIDYKLNSLTFDLTEIKDLKLIYTGIFGDTYSNSLSASNTVNTKDGSGNYFSFSKDGKEYTFNLVLEDNKDKQALKTIFENLKSDFNLEVQLLNK